MRSAVGHRNIVKLVYFFPDWCDAIVAYIALNGQKCWGQANCPWVFWGWVPTLSYCVDPEDEHCSHSQVGWAACPPSPCTVQLHPGWSLLPWDTFQEKWVGFLLSHWCSQRPECAGWVNWTPSRLEECLDVFWEQYLNICYAIFWSFLKQHSVMRHT